MVLIGSVGSLPDPDDRFLHVLYTQFFFFFFFCFRVTSRILTTRFVHQQLH
ncbi:hypothetical protein HanHA300_Chr13g0489371 [Helianthus annuus]|nr:hypothetical protein HanHA300_Chr13g0489371 [Helianthus annuus]KAJ0481999.1 hypothetical protein HanIR_Chr13g0649011 [Helianthus annuus]KAJ0498344.1 hypothetical protein HanHA89_Chr13g0521511 [Helianthus annuus]KAJ0664354.1 hypothetical protein HanLR1_Chr13g0491441 [Helianthus annuus]KAJ0671817.1 hypothetical protein HanOQP8_Chr13g0489931 [Helianthus annuus]